MKKNNLKKTESLSMHAFFLISARLLSLPISFFVPIVLVRNFSISEFGQYKQLFMIYNMALPLMSLGVTQGLIYFVPKYPERQKEIISQFVTYQIISCSIALLLFCLFQHEIAVLFTSSGDIASFIPYIGLFLVFWSLSNNLEIVLTATKKVFHASLFVFVSAGTKSLITIVIVTIFGGLKAVLIGFVTLGVIRFFLFMVHIIQQKNFSFTCFDKKLFKELLQYSVPLGVAVCVNSLMEYTSQFVVSNQLSVTEFAMYSIGCFQVPFIGMVSMSVSRVAIVKICELHKKHENSDITILLNNSFRKLAMVFFPAFVLLWAVAHDFIVLLYTDAYTASIPIFRTFIWILPLSAILVEYVPNALGDSIYVFRVNCITFVLNICAVLVLLHFFGMPGAAAGFVFARAMRKILILSYLKNNLNTCWGALFPYKACIKIFLFAILSLLPGLIFQQFIPLNPVGNLLSQGLLYGITCMVFFWNLGILTTAEKEKIELFFQSIVQKIALKI